MVGRGQGESSEFGFSLKGRWRVERSMQMERIDVRRPRRCVRR